MLLRGHVSHAGATRRGVLLVCACLATACEEDPKPTAKTASPPPEGLVIDDEPVDTEPALAIGTKGESSIRVAIPLEPLGCEALKRAYPSRPDGSYLDLWLRRTLEPDGSDGPWTIRSLYLQDGSDGRGLTTRGAMVEDVLRIPDGRVLKDLDVAAQDRQRLMIWSGDLRVESCGRVPRPEEDRPQEDLSVKVAGKPFSIHGATVRPKSGKLYLRLTHAPHTCESAITEGYDFYLDLAVEGDPPKLAFASLQGDRFPGDPSGSKGKKPFVVEPTDDDETLRGVGEVEVKLDGELELGPYPVAIDGVASVERCTPADGE